MKTKLKQNHLIFLDFQERVSPTSRKENFLKNWELASRKILVFLILRMSQLFMRYPLVVLLKQRTKDSSLVLHIILNLAFYSTY